MKPHATKPLPPAWIPLSFFGFGVAALGAACLWLLLGAPLPLALLHLLVVGVFAMVAMGALYQFVPVVGMVRLRLVPLAPVHLALAVAGTTAIVLGFQSGNFALVRWGGTLHLIGALLEGLVLYASLRGASIAFPARLAAIALTWFIATAFTGAILATGLAHGLVPQAMLRVHPVLGLAGFFGTIVAAVSFRLLRMFERINEEPRAPTRVIAVIVAALIACIAIRYGTIVLCLVAAVLMYDVVDIARRRNPAYQRETFWYTTFSFAGALAASIASADGAFGLAVTLAVWFFVGTAVTGYMQRIVPFIWWIARARRSGPKNVPALKDMNHSPLGYAILAFWISAGLLWLSGRPSWAAVAGLIAWLGLVLQLLRPFVVRLESSAARPI